MCASRFSVHRGDLKCKTGKDLNGEELCLLVGFTMDEIFKLEQLFAQNPAPPKLRVTTFGQLGS